MTTVELLSNVWKRSFQTRAWVVLASLVTVFAAACGGVPKTYYYTLQAPTITAPATGRTNYVLGVEHFRAVEVLRDDRIVYYESPTQMNFYQYHRWGADPATLLTEYTAQWLDSSGVFAQVRTSPTPEPVDYTLGGRVLSFEEVDFGGSARVRMALELTLVRRRDRKLVWSDQQRREAPVQERGVAGVANALNAACAQALRDMVPGLIAQVERDFQTGTGQSH